MTVRKTPDSKWIAQIDIGTRPDGTRIRRSRTCRTRKEAKEAEMELLNEKDMMDGNLSASTFGGFVEGFWWPMKSSCLRQTSLDSYEQDLRLRILPALAAKDVASITRMDIQSMVTSCGSESTAKRARDLTRAILNEAVSAGLIDRNPAIGRFQMPRAPAKSAESADERWLTTFESHAPVLKAARDAGEVEKIVILGLCMGLRKEEMLAADVSDVDFGASVVRVRGAYVQTSKGNSMQPTKTPESRRAVPMPAYAASRLSALLAGCRPSSPLVRARDGSRLPPSTATKMMRRFAESAGVPGLTIQAMRHSFASACIDAGVDIAKVSKLLGHTNITTTYNRYVKARRNDLRAIAGKVDDALGSCGLSADNIDDLFSQR